MITANQVEQIVNKLSLQNKAILDENLGDEVSCIVYRRDVFEYGNNVIISKHIDIEFSFGKYCEVPEETSLFQFICTLCNLSLCQEEEEIIIYQK